MAEIIDQFNSGDEQNDHYSSSSGFEYMIDDALLDTRDQKPDFISDTSQFQQPNTNEMVQRFNFEDLLIDLQVQYMKMKPQEICCMKFTELSKSLKQTQIEMKGALSNQSNNKSGNPNTSGGRSLTKKDQRSSMINSKVLSNSLRLSIKVDYNNLSMNFLTFSGIFFRALVNSKINRAIKLPFSTLLFNFLSNLFQTGKLKDFIYNQAQLFGHQFFSIITHALGNKLNWIGTKSKDSNMVKLYFLVKEIITGHEKIKNKGENYNEKAYLFQNDQANQIFQGFKKISKTSKPLSSEICQAMKYTNIIVADVEISVFETKKLIDKYRMPLYLQEEEIYSIHDASEITYDIVKQTSQLIRNRALKPEKSTQSQQVSSTQQSKQPQEEVKKVEVGLQKKYLRHSQRALYAFWVQNICKFVEGPIKFYWNQLKSNDPYFEITLFIHSTLDTCIECDTFLSRLSSLLWDDITDGLKLPIDGKVRIHYSYSIKQEITQILNQSAKSSERKLLEKNYSLNQEGASYQEQEVKKTKFKSLNYQAETEPRTLDDQDNPTVKIFTDYYLAKKFLLQPRTYFVSATQKKIEYGEEKKILLQVAKTLNSSLKHHSYEGNKNIRFGKMHLNVLGQNSFIKKFINQKQYDFIIYLVQTKDQVKVLHEEQNYEVIHQLSDMDKVIYQKTNNISPQLKEKFQMQDKMFNSILAVFNKIWQQYHSSPKILIKSKDCRINAPQFVKLLFLFFFSLNDRNKFHIMKQILLPVADKQNFDTTALAFQEFYRLRYQKQVLLISEGNSKYPMKVMNYLERTKKSVREGLLIKQLTLDPQSNTLEILKNYIYRIVIFLRDDYSDFKPWDEIMQNSNALGVHQIMVIVNYDISSQYIEMIQGWGLPTTILIKGMKMQEFYYKVKETDSIVINKDQKYALINEDSLIEHICAKILIKDFVPRTKSQVYCLNGPESLTLKEYLDKMNITSFKYSKNRDEEDFPHYKFLKNAIKEKNIDFASFVKSEQESQQDKLQQEDEVEGQE